MKTEIEVYAGEHMSATVISKNPNIQWPGSTMGGIMGDTFELREALRMGDKPEGEVEFRKFRITIERIN